MKQAAISLFAAAVCAQAGIITQNIGGTSTESGIFEPGQSFTTPGGGPWDDIRFSFFSDQGVTPVALGVAYIFSSAFSGNPIQLISAMYLAASTGVSGGAYVFNPSFTLAPNTQYFLYTGAPIQGFPGSLLADGNVISGGNQYLAFGATQFNRFSTSTNFQVTGDAITGVPESGTLFLVSIGAMLFINGRRH